MRQLFLGIILISFIGCSEREPLPLTKELQKLCDQGILFKIKNDKPQTIETKNGVKIHIPLNTFVLKNGRKPKDTIQIEIKEVFEKSEMILNRLGTSSNGKILESFGMIFLKASSGNSELFIQNGKAIFISIPNKKKGNDGELFYGTQTDSLLNWEHRDSTEVIPERGMDDLAVAIPGAYKFRLTKLGWINCDRFIEFTDKISLEIVLPKFSQPVSYLVFSDINSVLEISFNENGVAIVNNLPNKYPVELIVIDKIEGNFMWAKQKLTLGKLNKIELKTSETTVENITNELKKLDK